MNFKILRRQPIDISYQSDYSNLEFSFSRYWVSAIRSIHITCTANHRLIDLDCISKQNQVGVSSRYELPLYGQHIELRHKMTKT